LNSIGALFNKQLMRTYKWKVLFQDCGASELLLWVGANWF
jgi:hypothetical protein